MNTKGVVRRRLVAACAAAWVPAAVRASTEPAAGAHILAALPGAQLVGAGRYTWFGLKIYEVALFAPNARYEERGPFALELTYARAFKGRAIAERSLEEMRRAADLDDATAERWLALLAALFPDVARGDRLTGVLRQDGTAPLFHNGRDLGRIDTPALTHAFFAIWLGHRTSAPGLRARLIGAARDAR